MAAHRTVGSIPQPTTPEACGDSVTESERDRALAVFLAERTRLFRIAHRVTGNAATADEVVQEAWLRWQRVDRKEVRNPSAFLATATTHLAINVIQAAHHRHEMASPTAASECRADPSPDPSEFAERTDVATKIIGLLLTRLTPMERAVYLLHRGLEYPYPRIADLLGINIPHARQLARRAQANLRGRRSLPVSEVERARLVAAFLRATRAGDLEPLEILLAQTAARRSPSEPRAPRGRSPPPGRRGRSRHTNDARPVTTTSTPFPPPTERCAIVTNNYLEAAAQDLASATATPPFLYELGPAGARKVLDDLQAQPVDKPHVDEEWITVPAEVGAVRVRIVKPVGGDRRPADHPLHARRRLGPRQRRHPRPARA